MRIYENDSQIVLTLSQPPDYDPPQNRRPAGRNLSQSGLNMNFRKVGAIVVAAVLAPLTIAAQIPTGSIRGQITLAGRVSSAVAGVRVRLASAHLETTTDSTGHFNFVALPTASYTLTVTMRTGLPIRRQVSVVTGTVTEVTFDIGESPLTLAPLVATATRPLHVIGHLPDVRDNVVYAGKKTEVIVVDSLQANLAQDVERQILGRIPGANFSETAASGFPSNGVGLRGLNPTQSVEMNTRQNGVNIAADLYGYPETYYTPPSQALDRIEVVRGAGSLAFGPQFGGMINYVIRSGALNTKPASSVQMTTGSFGLVNGFGEVSGGSARSTYYTFVNLRGEDGWRPNSDFRQVTAYGNATLQLSDRLTLGTEFTFYRNRIHMPGGLSDSEFAQNPHQSFRARNWLASPWNLVATRLRYRLSSTADWQTTLSYLAADRHLIWRNEDGGPEATDSIDPLTGTFVPREVEQETFHNETLESRLRVDHSWFGRAATTVVGIRVADNHMERFEGGPGSTGADFNMSLVGGTWEKALTFGTTNLSPFIESMVHASDRLTIAPGARFEYVRSTASGYTDLATAFAPQSLAYPLFGVGTQYLVGASTMLYANVSQAYRPVLYASLTPFGSIARIDSSLHSSRGFNADLGWRGTVGRALKFDASVFYLHYGDRVGLKTVDDGAGNTLIESANIGDSRHQGVEAYMEFDPPGLGGIDLFTSFAFVDARYTSGQFTGNRVEQAPRIMDRTGLTYGRGPMATTLQVSYTAASYGDANNSVTPTANAASGFVPAYTLFDWSARARLSRMLAVSFGINNLTNARYFTKRTDEYPGPGILPGIGRSIYATIGTKF
ncbi:MAG: TonB-dependent receptor domain-containing protein [Gemmatimonadales bacterium]